MDLVTTVGGSETTPYKATCPNGVDVSLWKMQNAGHVPWFQPEYPGLVIAYLLSYSKLKLDVFI